MRRIGRSNDWIGGENVLLETSQNHQNLNLDKKESIKITAIGEPARPTNIPKVRFCEALCRSRGVLLQYLVAAFVLSWRRVSPEVCRY